MTKYIPWMRIVYMDDYYHLMLGDIELDKLRSNKLIEGNNLPELVEKGRAVAKEIDSKAGLRSSTSLMEEIPDSYLSREMEHHWKPESDLEPGDRFDLAIGMTPNEYKEWLDLLAKSSD